MGVIKVIQLDKIGYTTYSRNMTTRRCIYRLLEVFTGISSDVSKLETSQERIIEMGEESTDHKALAIFEGKQFRRAWHSGAWYYCIVDIIAIVTDSPQPRVYWSQLKNRLKSEGFLATQATIIKIKLRSFADGKLYDMECCTRPNLLRILLSVPSPKVEPFREWLAQLGEEAIQQAEDPDVAVERMRERYRRLGRDERWIQTRIEGDAARNGLTELWREGGIVLDMEYGILTGNLHYQTFGISIADHKQLKQLLPKANLRDHETALELAIGTVSDITATMLGEQRQSQGFQAFLRDTTDAGKVGRAAKEAAEQALGEPVVSPKNFLLEEQAVRQEKRKKQRKHLPPPEQGSLFEG